MDYPAAGTALCERCRLLRFDDSATGCHEMVDKEGVARLSFEDAEVEWRPRGYNEREGDDDYEYKLVQLGWRLDDSLPDMPQLSTSSQAGCDFCKSLRLILEKNIVKLSAYQSIHDGHLALTAYLSLREERVEGLMIEGIFGLSETIVREQRILFPIEASPGCQQWLGAEPVRSDGYLTPENTHQICRILAECIANCHPWQSSFLPTRLIDVGSSSCDIARLVLSSEVIKTAETKYAALSYCWGDKEDAKTQLRTETATLEQRLKGIPCDTMTPAIKDAVDITNAIGLRYIWIDALCIIQDDAKDWSYESGQMNRVFHGAFVTFCGLNSTSCHESFLKRARSVSFPFQSTLRPTTNGHISVRLQPLDGRWISRDIYRIDRSTSQWHKRAWTYQEEQLSNRLLLFGGSKMHFKCGTHKWTEGDDKLSRSHESSVSLHDRITGIQQGEFPLSTLYETWDLLVRNYTYRSLTHDEDRFPAMSGLAQLVGQTLGDDYLAGHWKSYILTELAWSGLADSHSLQNYLQSIRERHYISPSWSWASCVGGRNMRSSVDWQTVSECTLLDVDVKTDLENPFGRVYGGYLRIRGKVAPVPSPMRKDSNDQWSTRWLLVLGGEDQEADILVCLDWLQRDDEESLQNLVMLLLHNQQPAEQPTIGHQNFPYTTEDLTVLTALMLYPTKIPDEYYRVGSVSSNGQAGYNLMRTWFESEGDEKVCTII